MHAPTNIPGYFLAIYIVPIEAVLKAKGRNEGEFALDLALASVYHGACVGSSLEELGPYPIRDRKFIYPFRQTRLIVKSETDPILPSPINISLLADNAGRNRLH